MLYNALHGTLLLVCFLIGVSVGIQLRPERAKIEPIPTKIAKTFGYKTKAERDSERERARLEQLLQAIDSYGEDFE